MNPTKLAIAILCTAMILGSAVPATAQLSSTASIGNAVPLITNIAVPSSVSPVAGDTKEVAVTIDAADNNGWQDLVAVLVTIEAPDGSTHVAQSTADSNEDGSGVSKSYSYSFDMQYYDEPGTYKVIAVAEDANAALSIAIEQTFVYEELAALSLVESSLSFGTVDPGVRSSEAQLTVVNTGNVGIDLETSGSALVYVEDASIEIAVDRVKYDLQSDAFESEQSLSETPTTNAFALAAGPESSGGTWWALEVPSGEDQYIPAGEYSGSLTVSAVKVSA